MSELPLPYVPIDPLIEESEKFQLFVEQAELYDDPMALLYIVRLLLYAGRKAVDGTLGKLPDRAIARSICKYTGDAERFVKALRDTRWIEDTENGLIIRNWYDWGGRAYKERIRKRKDQPGEALPEDSGNVPGSLPEPAGEIPHEGKGKGKGKSEEEREEETPPVETALTMRRGPKALSLARLNERKQWGPLPTPPYSADDLEVLARHWGWAHHKLTPEARQCAEQMGQIAESEVATARPLAEAKPPINVSMLVYKISDARRQSSTGPPASKTEQKLGRVKAAIERRIARGGV